MDKNIFQTVQGQHTDQAEASRIFDRQIREAVRQLMQYKEGRVFLRWLGMGQSAHSILQRILDYEEEKHVSKP